MRRTWHIAILAVAVTAALQAPALGATSLPAPSRPLPAPSPAPAVPTSVSVIAGDMANTISWRLGARDISAVYVLCSTSETGPWTLLTPRGVKRTTTYTHAVSRPGRLYYVVARGVVAGSPVRGSSAVANDRVRMSVPVGPAGRTLAAANGAFTLAIPAGALASTVTVGIDQTAAPQSDGALLMAPAYSCTPDGLTFAIPATLAIAYRVPVAHFQVAATMEAALELGTYSGGRWSAVPSVTDTSADIVSGPISHFSYWSAPVIQPHGTTPAKTSFCSGICHNLVTMPGSSIGLPSTDRQTCYNCHGNQFAAQAPAGSNGVNIEAQFFECDTQSKPASATVHPVDAGLLCTDCHNAHRDPTAGYTDLLRSYDAVTGRAVETKPGSPAGAAYCLTCHGTRENARIAARHPGYWTAAGGDKSAGYASSAHASVAATSSVTCGVCHDPHSGAQDSLLPAREGVACTGGGGGACHSSSANAAGGSNVYSQLTTGAAASTHHDVMPAAQAASGARIECSSCHNPHQNSASTPISDPDDPSVGFTAQFTTSVDPSGALYLLVGAEHDGVAPVISAIAENHAGANYNVPVITWTTNEPADSWIDFGATTSYGSAEGTATLSTAHSVRLPTLTTGQTYHYRIRTADALGNTATSADYSYTVVQPPASPTLTPVAPNPFPGNGSFADIPVSWSAVTCPDGHAVQYQLRVNGTIGDWDATPYNWVSPTWQSGTTATLPSLTEGTYTWTVVARDATHTWAISAPSAGNTVTVTNAPNSCPFLFTWDGSGYDFEVDLYDAGKLGVPTSTGQLTPSPRDYYVLQTDPVAKDGALEFKVVGERYETDYLDAAGLYAVDIPAGTELLSDSADYGMLLGALGDSLHTVAPALREPVSATHVDTGDDVLAAIRADDGAYVRLNSDNNDFTYQTLEIDLGDFGGADQVKLVIDHSVVFPSTAAGMALRQTFGPRDKLEVVGADGDWVEVPRTLASVPKPGEFQRTDVVDITGIFPTADHRIRMTYLFESYIDRVGVDLTTDRSVAVTPLALSSATLAEHGIDGVTPEEVYEYAYGEPNEHRAYFAGAFTRLGAVDPLLAGEDDMFVVFGGGDEITLRFQPPADVPAPGMDRRYVLYTYGFYKGTTTGLEPQVGPLPFSGMSQYPYPSGEHYPDDAAHTAYQAEWNTRVKGGTAAQAARMALVQRASFKVRHYSTPVVSTVVAAGPYSVDTDRASLEVAFPGAAPQTVSAAAAWESTTTGLGVKPTPAAPGTPVSASRLASATTDNGVYLRTDLTTADRAVNWQVLKFDLSAMPATKKTVTVRWNGHGEPTTGYTTRVAVWNPQAAAWAEIRGADTASDADAATIFSPSVSTFCLRCHDGAPPAGVTVPSSVTNVNATWATEFHGGAAGAGFGGTIKSPYRRGNEAIGCNVCHDSHGNDNLYHLATTVNGTSGISVKTPQQMTNLCVACHAGTVTQWHQGCIDCHAWGGHGSAWVNSPEVTAPTGYPNASSNCQLCHNHGSKSSVGSDNGTGVNEWARIVADPSYGTTYGCHGCHGWTTTF